MKARALGVALVAVAGALAAAGCGRSVNVGSLPLTQTFDECSDGFSMNDEVSTVECTDGQLRILVSKPELSPMHTVPFRFDPSVEGVTVTSDLGLVEGRGDVGIGCDASGPGEPGRGYLFVVHGDLRSVGILRLESIALGDGMAFVDTTRVGARRMTADLSGRHRLTATCRRAAGAATALRFELDGRTVVDTIDRDGIWPFRSAVALVNAEAPGTDARFEELRAERTDPVARVDTTDATPGVSRYRIEVTHYDGRPVRSVSLGDEFMVVVSSPDALAGHDVPFELCANHGARPVCYPGHLDDGTAYATPWSVDPGEEVDGRLRLSVRVEGREVASWSAALRG